MKNATLFFLAFVFMFFACGESTQTNSSADTTVEKLENFPELIQRPEAIKMGKEWENITNDYLSWRKEIIEDDSALESRLRMAQLFIVEARVTGEHGHYYPAALQMCDEILERAGTNKDMHFMALTVKAGVQLSQHDFTAAHATATEAVTINPYNAQVYGALVDANVELGQYDQAVEMADKMISIRPDIRSYSRVSYLREIYGRIEGDENAFDAMNLAIEAGFPTFEETAWARLTMGYMLWNYGRLEEAENQFEIILDLRPNYPFAVAALGELAYERGEIEKADSIITAACKIIPEVGFYETLALIKKDQGKDEEYNKLVEEILEMYNDDVETGHNMSMEFARFYIDIYPDLDKAMTYAAGEYAIRPENISVNQLMSEIYFLKGANKEALEHIEKASVTGSVDPTLLCLRGLIYTANGVEPTKAKTDIQLAFKLNPNMSGDLASMARKTINSGKPDLL